jgi:hypothetical protein
MGVALVKNNAYSTLAATISSSDTTLNVAVGTGTRFPSIAGGSGDFFFLTLIDTSNNLEVVKVTAVSTDTMTIVRGQDGTTARGYASTSRVELRVTQGLIDDKVSVGGGTLTGHLEAPANAIDNEVPRVNEVVKKSGDTMSGPLIVPELRGPSNVIDVPSGHSIKGAIPGSLVAPGMVIQTIHKNVETVTTVATSASVEAEITDMFLEITPKYASSKILILMDVTSEASTHNFVFRLKRGATAIGTNSTVPLQFWVGWKSNNYDSNDDSTPQSMLMSYMDSPNTTSAVTYKLTYIPSAGNNMTFYLNRAVSGAIVGQSGYEIATSSITLMEIAQ